MKCENLMVDTLNNVYCYMSRKQFDQDLLKAEIISIECTFYHFFVYSTFKWLLIR